MDLETVCQKMKENPSIEIAQSADVDPTKYKMFLEHNCEYTRKENPVNGVSGGSTTYCYTPTTLGTVINISCACGKKDDITDYRCW